MSEKFVINISTSKVILEKVDSSYEDPVLDSQEFEWKKGELGSVLEDIVSQNEGTKFFRILISDNLCYVCGLTVEKKYSSDRNYIQSQAAEIIPEDLNIVQWDFVVKNIADGKAQIQVFAFSKLLNEEFNSISSQIKDKIKLILPCSLALLESFEEKDQSFLLIHADEVSQVIVAVINGVANSAITFSTENVSDKVLKLFSYLNQYLSFNPDKVVLSGSVNETLNKELKKNFEVVDAQIIPSVNILEINRVSGSDQKTLNISFENNKKEGVLSQLEENLQSAKNSGSNKTSVFIITLTVIALIGLVIGYLFVSQVLT